MRPSIAFERHRADVRSLVIHFRAGNLRVFGSLARGDDADGSDLDILVDALPGATLFDLGGLQVELEDMLGVPINLLTPEDLLEKFRAKALAEARPVEHTLD
ncbi:nucleotidyltransferase family protein [Thauera sp. SDU_THAU2]|uniref:nucleotidyltransferase family protein n=1 Tax=Thauera sp. SDU_THAU2 TaxID=3136633 RepID=UPI00311FCB69